ncbi:hypothetical protein Forpe1208_v008237 [Fusarium oxysporum f. sp. rapae]|uniref:Zn(2)-C6 fungal-type domain-containing protein n=1 Tax=Fusarium oxysporum f. sp. rapae TaxID=485398 RepID=A0A8J5NUW2_FUSOX|nr:hypothetical protein Forpe1208_v008237 [Fusarium oxysporum f. sp. rapae]
MAGSKLPQQEAEQTGDAARPKRRRIDRQRPDVTYSRKRAIAACRICRVKKVKCNNVRPVCGSCMASQSTCIYEGPEEDHSSFDPASIAILERLNQVLESVGDIPGLIKTSVETAVKNTALPPSPASRITHGVDAFSDGHELSSDDLIAPAAILSVESVLSWPILAGIAAPNHILGALSDTGADGGHAASLSNRIDNLFTANTAPLTNTGDEKEIPRLVRQFLQHVHPVNPILDVDAIYSHSLRVSETGITWDGESCIVLIACALGCIAKPYDAMVTSPSETSTGSSLESQSEELETARAYFELARQRLGLLDQSLLAAQCHFFAGVYYMFTLAPLRAWSQFEHAANIFYVYWKYQPRENSIHLRRLAQSFYWSCLKSQVELGLDLHLPQSLLKDLYDAGSELPMPPEIDACPPRQTTTIFPPPGDSPEDDLGCVQDESWTSTTSALCIMAVVKSGRVPAVHEMDWRGGVQGLVKKIRYWEDEAAAAGRCADVLEVVISSVERSLL